MKNGLADITVILDRSGSMSSVVADTIGGFNTFLKGQQDAPGEATITLRQFDDQHEVLYTLPVKTAPPLTAITFQPRGSTALLDAIGMAIEQTGTRLKALPESERPERVIMAIITDGEENASRLFTRAKVFAMIGHQRAAYNWLFTFIGANQDAIGEAGSLNIPQYAALNYTSSSAGTNAAFHAATSNLTRARSGVAGSSSMSYTVAEQQAAMADDDQIGTFHDDDSTAKP